MSPHGTEDLAETIDKSPHNQIYEYQANEVPLAVVTARRSCVFTITLIRRHSAVCDSDRTSRAQRMIRLLGD